MQLIVVSEFKKKIIYLTTHLIAALANLQVDYFPHFIIEKKMKK